MITIVIQHPVADYEAWKGTFERPTAKIYERVVPVP
jgi:hypothetical protein